MSLITGSSKLGKETRVMRICIILWFLRGGASLICNVNADLYFIYNAGRGGGQQECLQESGRVGSEGFANWKSSSNMNIYGRKQEAPFVKKKEKTEISVLRSSAFRFSDFVVLVFLSSLFVKNMCFFGVSAEAESL